MSIESQRAGEALPESEEHYRAVAEAATDAIITIDSVIECKQRPPTREEL